MLARCSVFIAGALYGDIAHASCAGESSALKLTVDVKSLFERIGYIEVAGSVVTASVESAT